MKEKADPGSEFIDRIRHFFTGRDRVDVFFAEFRVAHQTYIRFFPVGRMISHFFPDVCEWFVPDVSECQGCVRARQDIAGRGDMHPAVSGEAAEHIGAEEIRERGDARSARL